MQTVMDHRAPKSVATAVAITPEALEAAGLALEEWADRYTDEGSLTVRVESGAEIARRIFTALCSAGHGRPVPTSARDA